MASEDGDEAPLSDVKFRLIESEAAPGASNGIPSVLFDAFLKKKVRQSTAVSILYIHSCVYYL